MGLETQEILIQTSADFKKFAAKIDFSKLYYLNTLFPKPSSNKAFLLIISSIRILKYVAITSVKFGLVRRREKCLVLIIYTPHLSNIEGKKHKSENYQYAYER